MVAWQPEAEDEELEAKPPTVPLEEPVAPKVRRSASKQRRIDFEEPLGLSMSS